MRTRSLVAIAALLLPAGLNAQRIPMPRGRGPARPAPLPPQPAPIANELAYRRLPLSVESYPFVSYFQSPGFLNNGLIANWTSFGMGTRADYRITHLVSATLDLTSSFYGGPALVQTAELGTRLRPEPREEQRLVPFADVRVGYVAAYSRSLGGIFDDIPGNVPDSYSLYGATYSHGFGGLAGVGMDYSLSRSWSLTSAWSVARNRMKTHDLRDLTRTDRHYAMTSYRVTLGVRYNPVRVIRPAATELR